MGKVPAEPTCAVGDTVCTARLNAFKAAKTAGPIATWYNGNGTSGNVDPKKCTVAAVKNASGTQVRPAVTYFSTNASPTSATQLASETQSSKWQKVTATANAKKVLETPSNVVSTTNRWPEGDVSWLEGKADKFQWLTKQRERENEFYKSVNAAILVAKGWANSMATDKTYKVKDPTTDVGAKAFQQAIRDLKTGADTENTNRYKKDAESPAKLLETALTNRDSATENGGSGNKMGGVKRTQGSAGIREYLTTWTPMVAADLTALLTWFNAQGGFTAKAKQYTWWVTAREASKLNETWNTDMYTKSLKAGSDTLTASGADLDNKAFFSAPPSVAVKNSGADKQCDETK